MQTVRELIISSPKQDLSIKSLPWGSENHVEEVSERVKEPEEIGDKKDLRHY